MISVLIFVVGIAAVSADDLWQEYVDDQLVGAGIKGAAIFGHDGSVLAKNNVEPTTEETKKILEQFNNPVSGITFGGVKYFRMTSDSHSLYGMKDTGGIICIKTNQVVIVGVYDHTLQPGVASIIVERLGHYLNENGY